MSQHAPKKECSQPQGNDEGDEGNDEGGMMMMMMLLLQDYCFWSTRSIY